MQPNTLQQPQDGGSLEELGRLFIDGARAQTSFEIQLFAAVLDVLGPINPSQSC